MKAALDAPKTSARLREEISALKKEQLELEVFLRDVARADDDALDFYFQTDDLKYRENDEEWKDHYNRLEVSSLSFRRGAGRSSCSSLDLPPVVFLFPFLTGLVLFLMKPTRTKERAFRRNFDVSQVLNSTNPCVPTSRG